jgi:hypothetical protein
MSTKGCRRLDSDRKRGRKTSNKQTRRMTKNKQSIDLKLSFFLFFCFWFLVLCFFCVFFCFFCQMPKHGTSTGMKTRAHTHRQANPLSRHCHAGMRRESAGPEIEVKWPKAAGWPLAWDTRKGRHIG